MRLAIIPLLFLVACASRPLAPDCDKPYAHTLPHCAPPPSRQHEDLVEVCEVRGGAETCWFVRRTELNRILRSIRGRG